MRKKKIIEQNSILFKQIESLQGKIKELTEKIDEQAEELEKLRAVKVTEEKAETAEEPIKAVKDKVLNAVYNAEEYGAKAIGRIVVCATKATSGLSEKTGANKVDVVNLILGRAEVAKADILNAVSSVSDKNEQKITIDSIVEKTCDYFEKTINNIP